MSDITLEQPKEASQRWRRSSEGGQRAERFDPSSIPLPAPGNEIERILREYACECYAVGRGESMYYLVEDLPRLARDATQEILAIQEQNGGNSSPRGFRRRESKKLPKKAAPSGSGAGVPQGMKSAVAALPIIAILGTLGIAIGLTFRQALSALVGGAF